MEDAEIFWNSLGDLLGGLAKYVGQRRHHCQKLLIRRFHGCKYLRGGEFEGLNLRRWSLSAARSARYSAKKIPCFCRDYHHRHFEFKILVLPLLPSL